MKTYTFGLCENRHDFPTREGIFPKHIEDFRTDLLEKRADQMIPQDCERLELYASGLVKAAMAVVKVCVLRGIHLTVFHYSPEYHMYTKQDVL